MHVAALETSIRYITDPHNSAVMAVLLAVVSGASPDVADVPTFPQHSIAVVPEYTGHPSKSAVIADLHKSSTYVVRVHVDKSRDERWRNPMVHVFMDRNP